jgi:hypothetical protein
MSNAIETQVIDIPAGSVFVRAADITQWIAERLAPILNASIDLESLPEEFHADASEWARCADLEAKDRQLNLRNRHFWILNAAAEAREIALYSWEDRTPVFSMERDALMRVDDARRYLEPMGFELREVTESADAQAKADAGAIADEEQAESASWVERAREIALEYIDKHAAMDLHPSQDDVAEHVEKECRVRKVFGPRGPLGASTIKREAIQGDWWTQNKPAKRMGNLGKPGKPG